MSREISEDFKNLLDFVKKYDIKILTEDKSFVSILSQLHKKFFSYLNVLAEISRLRKKSNLKPIISDIQIEFIEESCSDIGSSIFLMIHGSYKASRFMLRSSIETFHKGFNTDDLPDLFEEKNIYKLFDKLKTLPIYLNINTKKIFDSIYQDYKTLCLDVHTAFIKNMQHMTALNYFPTFDEKQSDKICKILKRLVSNYIFLLIFKYNQHFIKMHYLSKQNIIENIPQKLRPLIMGIDNDNI